MVSLLQTMLEGVGILIGSSIAGVIFKDFGGKKLFLIYSFFSMFWAIVLAVYIFIFKKKKEQISEANELSNMKEWTFEFEFEILKFYTLRELIFAGTNFCGSQFWDFLWELNFADFSLERKLEQFC